MNCQCTPCPQDGFCSDRQEFGLMTFENAQQQCIDVGLVLPIPGSAAEANIVNASGSVGPIWIGITHNVTEDSWIRRVFTTMLETRLLKHSGF